MRVVLLPSAYAPAVGGVEELSQRLALRLRQRGNEVEVWTIRHPSSLPALDVLNGIPVRRFAFPLPSARPMSVAAFPNRARVALGALSEDVRRLRPDVLHVQCFSAQGIYAAALAARHHIPFVVSLQGETVMDDHDIYEQSLTLRLGLRTALRRAQAVTGCSAFVLDDAVRRFGLRPGKGHVVANGVELEGDDRPRPFTVPFNRFVLTLGRAVPKKGFDLLVRAFAEIAHRNPGVGLVIGGEGPSRMDLGTLARHLGVESQVFLPGRLDRAEVAWAMSQATVFVLPSRVEPFGIVVLEAMRAGRPVVVTAHGGASEIVRHQLDGLVVNPFKATEMGAAIDLLLTDAVLADRLAAAGRRRVQAYSWQEITDQYTGLYEAVSGRDEEAGRSARGRSSRPARQLPGAPANRRLST